LLKEGWEIYRDSAAFPMLWCFAMARI